MLHHRALLAAVLLLAGASASATIFGRVSGLIHDPQHRPVQGARAEIHALASQWAQSAATDAAGEFRFDSVPLGEYQVSVEMTGFSSEQQRLVMTSGRDARLHFGLAIARAQVTVEVSEQPPAVDPQSSTTSSVISRRDVGQTPGADQPNSMAMITSYVPGAYMVHDQLHIRGGHQVSWLLDGVPVPNTNIASNVGPQFDPGDIDYLEVQRGGYNAEYGDRTYGVFNVVTRSGFERNREAELVASYGSYNGTSNQLSFGDHSERFAYYGSVSGYRTDLGLETPAAEAHHDLASGVSAFGSLIFNRTPRDQLRLVTSLRGDHFQVPNDAGQQRAGLRDVENERDLFANFSWIHTVRDGAVLTLSPFYHFNRAHYLGQYGGAPDPSVVIPEDDRGSNYFGGVASLAVTHQRHTLHAGLQVFGQRDNQFFGITASDLATPPLAHREMAWGSVEALFLEDQFRLTHWLTLNAGVRLTHFAGAITENAADPRLGAALRIPRLGWVARAFWGRYYQAPPLLTVSGPLLEVAAQQGFGFLPLRGERDEQREFGLNIPVAGWSLDLSHFRTGARNFFDHDALGNSNIFFPLTIERARIHGYEASAASPRIAGRAQWRLAYSRQYVEGAGGVSGGLTEFLPPEQGYFPLDHDQRDTLSTGVNLDLPRRTWAAVSLNYGSGFLDGDGPRHLPSHATYDLSLGKAVGENWSLRLTALNLTNHRYLLDNSNTFGGTHYANPRELAVQVKYRLKY